jgi:hypothetical protein
MSKLKCWPYLVAQALLDEAVHCLQLSFNAIFSVNAEVAIFFWLSSDFVENNNQCTC